MKRKRSPSPASQRPTSRSPLSPRSTRASTTSPAAGQLNGVSGKSADTSNNDEDNNVNGGSFNIRRSSRARRLSYPIFNSNFMTRDDVVRNRGLIKEAEDQQYQRIPQQPPRSRSTTPDTEDSPFLHHHSHVRFSPSAKPGSPARISRRQRQAASIARMRLQNVPSEDEQSEFNRRYSRDLRSRRRQETTKETDNLTSTPISTRRTARFQEKSEIASDDNGIASDNDVRTTRKEKIEAANEADDEDEPLGRRLRKHIPATSSKVDNCNDDVSISSEPTIRRSLRKPTPKIAKQTSEQEDANSEEEEPEEEELEEDEDDKAELSSTTRPKRSRAPVERFGYEPPTSPPRYNGRHSRRHHRGQGNEINNLDKYSSNEEFQGKSSDDDVHSRRKKKYNMRSKTQRKKIISYRSRDTSSSSSNESVDEQRFAKRKNKRMMVERSKLRPVNLSKQDATKAIFRERKSVGASMADIQPMEMDMGVTFESVGGVDDHINSLREMVIFPLLYPEIFTKFSMTPPRGVLFYGPPGTGKTLIARALASECSSEGRKVAFFMRKGADCLSKWIGESERQLRLLFDQAYLMRPSIIFFDEIDGLAPVRSSRNDQIHSSIVSTLLALMDGLDNRGEIIVIGATNRIENIDPALRRPGRFDRELRFGLPTRDSRKAILSLHTKSWQPCVDEEMVNLLADKTIGYSGADLKGLCVEATLNALRRRYPQVYQTSQKLALNFDQIQIKERDFCQAMDKLVPSTHRIQDQSQSPLVPRLRPLLGSVLAQLCQKLDDVNKGHEFSYRPRLCIRGVPGQCLSTYLGPAVLHHLEKLPCHKLDIPSLFSNSARSPEEAMFHIIHEAKRTVPSVLYIPHIMRLWKKVLSFAQREAFLAMMSEIQPKAPLIVIAFTEDKLDDKHACNEDDEDFNDDILVQMFDPETEVFEVENANDEQRREYFKPIFEASTQPPEEDVRDEESVEILTVLPIPESRELTEKEEKRLRRKEDGLLRELRIFLRDTWLKINREQKFFMFRTPVDTEEIYDYLEYVEKPMDFDLMLTKLDNAEYRCAQDFLDDIDLIANNALKYNSDLQYETNKVICHRARALQDFAYALLKAEMDTDFEDNCKEIISRRKKLTEKLNKPTKLQGFDPKTKAVVPLASTSSSAAVVPANKLSEGVDQTKAVTAKQTPKKKKRKSRWSSGLPDKKRSKRVPKRDDHENVDQNQLDNDVPASVETSMEKSKDDSKLDQDDTFENEESDSDEEVTLNESKEMKIDFKKLKGIEDDLVKGTKDFHIEDLERIFTKLMECVSKYKNVYDRSQLPQDLTEKMKTLKLLPQKKKS